MSNEPHGPSATEGDAPPRHTETAMESTATFPGRHESSLSSKITEYLRQEVHFCEPWMIHAAHLLRRARHDADLVAALRDKDANTRIVAAHVLGSCAHLLTGELRTSVIEEMGRLLHDNGMSEYAYGSYQCEEDTIPVVVAHVAAAALARLTGSAAEAEPDKVNSDNQGIDGDRGRRTCRNT